MWRAGCSITWGHVKLEVTSRRWEFICSSGREIYPANARLSHLQGLHFMGRNRNHLSSSATSLGPGVQEQGQGGGTEGCTGEGGSKEHPL